MGREDRPGADAGGRRSRFLPAAVVLACVLALGVAAGLVVHGIGAQAHGGGLAAGTGRMRGAGMAKASAASADEDPEGTGDAEDGEAPPRASARYATHRDGDVTSTYHVMAEGIDWNEPVGVVFWFDGDSSGTDSDFYAPDGAETTGLARAANSRNMVLVPVLSPERAEEREGLADETTWWKDSERNGAWFRSLARELMDRDRLDAGRVWLAGWSGGADFITDEALARDADWIRGGGATLMGGGESPGMPTTPDQALLDLQLTWHEGEDDVPPEDSPDDWSGTTAGQEGIRAYREAGFRNTRLDSLPDTDHTGYDAPALLEEDLERAMPRRDG